MRNTSSCDGRSGIIILSRDGAVHFLHTSRTLSSLFPSSTKYVTYMLRVSLRTNESQSIVNILRTSC